MLTFILERKYIYAAAILLKTKNQPKVDMNDFNVDENNYQSIILSAIELYRQQNQNKLSDRIEIQLTKLTTDINLNRQSKKYVNEIKATIKKESVLISDKKALQYVVGASVLWAALAVILCFASGHIPPQKFVALLGNVTTSIAGTILISAASVGLGCLIAHRITSYAKLQKSCSVLDQQEQTLDPMTNPEVSHYFNYCKKQEAIHANKTLKETQFSCIMRQFTDTSIIIALDLFKLSILTAGPLGLLINISIGILTGLTAGLTYYYLQKQQSVDNIDKLELIKNILIGFLSGVAPGIVSILYAQHLAGIAKLVMRCALSMLSGVSIKCSINKSFSFIKNQTIRPASNTIVSHNPSSFFEQGKNFIDQLASPSRIANYR